MLLRYSGGNRFIFIANSKSASSSIEASKLVKYSDIRVTSAYSGKHMSLESVYQRFGFLYKEFPFETFFKFSVIRDPLDWVISWYNFRSRPGEKKDRKYGQKFYAGDISFEEFWQQNKDLPFLNPQSDRFFAGDDGEIELNYLIKQSDFQKDFAEVKEILDLSFIRIPRKNRSLSRVDAADISDVVKQEIAEKYARDYELYSSLAAFNQAGIQAYRSAVAAKKSTPKRKRDLDDWISEINYRLRTMLQ